MPIYITIGNQKGGVGKTTTAVNLSDSFSRNDKKVLVIDADPQGNTSSVLLKDVSMRDTNSLCSALEAPPGSVTLSSMAAETNFDNVKIVPNNVGCTSWERKVANSLDTVFGLKRLISNDSNIAEFDFVLIDTPPNVGAMVNCSLMISDYVIIPILASDQFSLDGFFTFMQLIQSIKNHNEKLKLLGVVITRFDSSWDLYVENRDRINSFFAEKGIHVFPHEIRQDVHIDMAHMKRKTVYELDPHCEGSQDYKMLSEEIITMICYENNK